MQKCIFSKMVSASLLTVVLTVPSHEESYFNFFAYIYVIPNTDKHVFLLALFTLFYCFLNSMGEYRMKRQTFYEDLNHLFFRVSI